MPVDTNLERAVLDLNNMEVQKQATMAHCSSSKTLSELAVLAEVPATRGNQTVASGTTSQQMTATTMTMLDQHVRRAQRYSLEYCLEYWSPTVCRILMLVFVAVAMKTICGCGC